MPCGVIEPESISLRKDAIFNQQSFTVDHANGRQIRYRQPVPVDIKVTVNFYTKTFTDIYQMFSNFAVFSNPYYFISLSVPSEIPKDKYNSEYRCKAEWDGSFNVDYPKSVSAEDLWVIKGTAGFSIEGYLFKGPVSDPEGIIYAIGQTSVPGTYTAQYLTDEGEYDYYVKKGWPFVNSVITCSNRYTVPKKPGGDPSPLPEDILVSSDTPVTLEGYSFFSSRDLTVLFDTVSGDIPGLERVTIETAKTGSVSGYRLSKENILSVTENKISLKLPKIENFSDIKLSVVTNVGYFTVPNKFTVL